MPGQRRPDLHFPAPVTFPQFFRFRFSHVLSLFAAVLMMASVRLAAQTQAPFFYGSSTITFSAGVPNVAVIPAAGIPELSFSTTPLPSWAFLDPLTGALSGRPPAAITSASWTFTVFASNTAGTASRTFTLNVRGPVQAVTSFSSRIDVSGAGNDIVFGVIGGLRKILLRNVGPGLAPFGVSGYLTNPQLQLTDANSGAPLQQNDNWNLSDASVMAQAGAFALPVGSSDSVIVATLGPGMYRAKFTGAGGTGGVALMEFYDVTDEAETGSCLTYLSIQGPAGSPSSNMEVSMSFAKATDSVLMRALGPGIGLAGSIEDPTFDLYKNSSYLTGNNDWSGLGSEFYRIGAKLLPQGSKDSAVLINSLEPAVYTARIINVVGTSGRVRFEVFPSAGTDISRPPLIDIGEPTRVFTQGVYSTLTVGVYGTRPLAVQWFKNDVAPLPAHPLSTDGLAAWGLGSEASTVAGVYTLKVTGPDGANYTSAPITVSMETSAVPLIVNSPQSTQVNVGNMVGFFATYSGTAPLSYQWRKNGVPIPGATSANLIFRANSVYDAGAYDVVVTNSAGSATSRRATLAMGQMPQFAAPLSHYVRVGDPVKLGAYPASNVFATHAWLKEGATPNRPFAVYNLEGQLAGEIAAGQSVPAGRWTTPNGGALYLAGMGPSQEGQIVGATNGPTYEMGTVRTADLGNYSADVTINSVTERRGPAAVALRGSGGLGRRFVMVDGGGRVSTSPDGQTWTFRTVGPRDFSGVAVKGDVVVAVGRGGTIQRSSDLENWTLYSNGTGTDLNAAVAGPDRFVAVGAEGRVVVSADGMDWYQARIATTTSLTGIAYGNGIYVMTGANGAIFASVDGFNWVNRNSQTTSEILFVTFAGTQFWALTTNNQLLTSPDGLTWTRTETTQPTWFRSLAYNGTTFVAVGTDGRVFTSPNGVAWTPRDMGSMADYRAITWSGVEVPSGFAPASLLSNLNFRILTPPYAVTATVGQPATFSVTTSGAPTSYQWYKGATRINGATGATYTIPSVQEGDVGGYWVQIHSAAGTLTSSTAGLQLLGRGPLSSQFIAVGENGVILTSPDGLQFVERASQAGRTWRGVAASAHLAVAVGRDNMVATSTDGNTWIPRTLSLPGDKRILRGVAAGVSQFVAVGSVGTIVVTFDGGDSWQLVPSGTTQSLWGVAWDGVRFVAVGEGGVVLTSPDGLSWSAGASPTAQRLYGIHVDGLRLVAVTEQGRAFASSDGGASWIPAGTSYDFWARAFVANASGRRMIVGDRGMIATSAGGSVWNLSASPTTARLYGVTWTGLAGIVGGNLEIALQSPTLRVLSEPQSVAGFVGGTATFSVTVGGVGPYAYQWLKSGVEIPQQTQSTLFLSNLQPGDASLYSVEVRNALGVVTSTSATLTVSVGGSGSAPTLASSPASRSVSVGSATNFVVAADGQAPFTYRWYFNGNPISGAVSATLALSNVQMANAGSYTVMVSNRYGSVTSAPAALTVTSVPGMPVISQQPASQAVAANGVAVFTVVATGTPTPSYQWRKDGNNIDGATQATYTVDPVQIASSGVYTVRVSNTVGEVISEPASLTVVPAGTTATHRQTAGRGYEAGGTVTITSTLTFVGQAQSAGWEVLLPAGWSYVSGGGAQGDIRPIAGETQLLSWAWTTPPASPITFTYTLQVPAGTVGAQALAAMAVLRQGGVPIRLMAQPDPLIIAPSSTLHAADTSGDQRIDLFELTRVIELYNTRNGSVRTGAYRIDAGGEDGFAGDTTRGANSSATLARYHSADTRNSGGSAVPDGALDLFELTRIIELYNHRAGNVRTGQYRVQAGTEDGFTPGP